MERVRRGLTDRESVLAALRAHERELRAAGLARLSLFGSVARDEAGPRSDVDLLATFDEAARGVSLLDMIRIENQIADILGVRVDLIEDGTLKPSFRHAVGREIVRAF